MNETNLPSAVKTRNPIDPKLGIKSALDELRSIVSAVYLLYIVNNKKDEIQYSEEDPVAEIKKIRFPQRIIQGIATFLGKQESEIKQILDNHKLVTTQYEPLYVGVTLFFKLANVSGSVSERTAGVRYNKKLEFASNIILLDLLCSSFDDTTLKTSLFEWLNNRKANNTDFEHKICKFLTICAQPTLMKIRMTSTDDIAFQLLGVYDQLCKGNQVNTKGENEIVGPNRVLSSFLDEGIDPYVKKIRANTYTINGTYEDADFMSDLSSFAKIIDTTLNITNVSVPCGKKVNTGTTTSILDKLYTTESAQYSYITALKTKPFLLLAGISGTGKSQLVKELAFMSCPNEGDFRNDPSTPGNYLMVEVKPNWHDSTELLGYYNALTERYELTPFIRFAYKACQNSSVPFFVCLDEMNLAPVEQYFAEYLSVLESRKKIGKVIQTSPLIKAEVLANCEAQKDNKDLYSEQDLEIINYIKECGLCLPSNLFVIGTVNMDDTTHQFSRKVIDRAFTIEMNGGDLSDMFKDDRQPILTYCDEPVPLQEFQSRFVQANELWEDDNYKKYREKISKSVPEKLNYINEIFKNTPFQVSYRVQNELVLYLAYLIEKERYPEKIDSLINEAVLAILMEKILPRVQGDEKLLGRKEESVFSKLIGWINKGLAYIGESQDDRTGMTTAEYGPSPLHKIVNDKLQSMGNRLENSFFTNFF